jgi:Fe-S-cluster containining protein
MSSRARQKREKQRRRAPRPVDTATKRKADVKRIRAAAAQAGLEAKIMLGRVDLADQVTALADQTRDIALKVIATSDLTEKHACQAGCAFCCYTAITVAPPEAFAIAAHLRANESVESLARIRQRLDENAEQAARMSREKYIASNIPCALLTDDGNCRAHAVRPIACAGFLSTSRQRCEDEFNRVPGRSAIPVDEFAKAAGLSVSIALRDAGREANRDCAYYELSHALRIALDRPDAPRDWAAGHEVFGSCMQ